MNDLEPASQDLSIASSIVSRQGQMTQTSEDEWHHTHCIQAKMWLCLHSMVCFTGVDLSSIVLNVKHLL